MFIIDILPFLIVPIVIISVLILSVKNAKKKWAVIPFLHEYKQQYPHCVTGRGMRCVKCGSGSIKSTLFSNVKLEKYIYNCGHCGVKLYKTENK
jgi:hypothetical protein